MKTRFKLWAVALVLGSLAFVSCDKEDPDSSDDTVVCNDIANFLSNFVCMDGTGKVELRLSGFYLNEADPTEISYCTDTWEEALKMTKSWLPEDAKYQETETSLTWEMRDPEGKSQGNLVLSKKSGEGLVAEVVLPASIPHVHTIRFVPQESWPQNSIAFVTDLDTSRLLEDCFYGNLVTIYTAPAGHDHGTGEFLVIREFDQLKNEKGIMFHISTNEYSAWDNNVSMKDRSRDMGHAKKVSSLYQDDKDFLASVIETADNFGSASNYCYAWERDPGFWDSHSQAIRINDGSTRNWNAFHPSAHELDIYYFWVEQEGDEAVFKIE